MTKFSKRLRELRNSRGLTQQGLAEKVGMSKSSINMYERGEREPGLELLETFADFFNVDMDYILGKNNIPRKTLLDTFNENYSHHKEKPNVVKIPVLGNVRAGIPTEAIEDIIDYEEIPQQMARNGEYFGLRVRGDSMEPKFSDGDTVIVRKQSDVDDGDIAIVLVNGSDATIKKIQKSQDGVALIPTNSAYTVLFYTNAEIKNLPVIVLGKVVELRAKF